MPNWCNNNLKLTHTDPEMIERAARAFADSRLLDEFIPIPSDLQIVAGRVGSDDDEKQKDLRAQEEVNLAKFNYKNWYDYCVNEWGTKWDVGGDDGSITRLDSNSVSFYFDSAWAPPIAAYERLLDLGFGVKAYYYESGMAFCGVFDADGDEGYNLSDMTSDQVKDAIPEDLDEMFGISETIANYEDEENQEIDLDGGVSAVNE